MEITIDFKDNFLSIKFIILCDYSNLDKHC